LSEQRKYRTFSAQQKLEIVLAGLRGDVSVKELCRQHEIAETLYYQWREKLLEGGREALGGKQGAAGRARVEAADRAARAGAGPQDVRAGDRGGSIAGLGVRARAARSRELVAKGRPPAVVARVLQVNRTGLYRTPKRRPQAARRPLLDPIDRLIVEVAQNNPTDGSRMVAALTSQRLGRQVNRKRAQRDRPLRRRRRPGFFRVERPDQLWHLDMTAVWVAEHGWTYLNAIIDCCTREIVGCSLELRCRAEEAIELVDAAVAARGLEPGSLTLGTDNGSAFTSRAFRARLGKLGITHRRGGYRDPESQAFIESWFGKLKQRLVWRTEFETLDDARAAIGGYIDSYHQRPHSGLRYRTPAQVRQTWEDGQQLLKTAA
jgi:putative transposase